MRYEAVVQDVRDKDAVQIESSVGMYYDLYQARIELLKYITNLDYAQYITSAYIVNAQTQEVIEVLK